MILSVSGSHYGVKSWNAIYMRLIRDLCWSWTGRQDDDKAEGIQQHWTLPFPVGSSIEAVSPLPVGPAFIIEHTHTHTHHTRRWSKPISLSLFAKLLCPNLYINGTRYTCNNYWCLAIPGSSSSRYTTVLNPTWMLDALLTQFRCIHNQAHAVLYTSRQRSIDFWPPWSWLYLRSSNTPSSSVYIIFIFQENCMKSSNEQWWRKRCTLYCYHRIWNSFCDTSINNDKYIHNM